VASAGGHQDHDPLIALAFIASATSALRLQTKILVLPYRNAFLTAKATASLDVLSGGRLTLTKKLPPQPSNGSTVLADGEMAPWRSWSRGSAAAVCG
jgi:Luciferase-like monooxygenase